VRDEYVLGKNQAMEVRMYRHDNPLKPRTDMGLWVGGTLAVMIVLGIVLYGVTRAAETSTSDRPAPMSSAAANR
jgi:hypothetical protein